MLWLSKPPYPKVSLHNRIRSHTELLETILARGALLNIQLPRDIGMGPNLSHQS